MKDILFDIAGNLTDVNESTNTHQSDILIHQKGWNKFAPHLGVGILNFIDDDTNVESVKSSITLEYERDGMSVNDMIVTEDGKIKIHANY